jgi:hypothetical protein
MKRTLELARLESDPDLVWNTFIDLLAMEEYEDLAPDQRPAHLIFWYESEVQNGGHGQYFENRRLEHLSDTKAALEAFGLIGQAAILSHAMLMLEAAPGASDWLEVFDETAIEEMDAAFHACAPDIATALHQHLNRNVGVYLEFV